jgi:cellulose synthase/poly-beta-1,6-N-acetylglucosamine synthase-like glycosyltransferase
MRDGVGCVTSCGTNCVWAIEKGFEYEERTMIEDTATSHKVILEGYEGTYHYEKLIFGTPKANKDFLAAIFRWSRGAVQLFWLAVFGGRTEGSSAIPFLWVVLVLMVLPMAVAIFGMLSCTGNGIASVRAFVAIYVLYFVLVTFMWTLAMSRRFGHLLRFVEL